MHHKPFRLLQGRGTLAAGMTEVYSFAKPQQELLFRCIGYLLISIYLRISETTSIKMYSLRFPFLRETQLNRDLDHLDFSSDPYCPITSNKKPSYHFSTAFLPGHPCITLKNSSQLVSFLKREFCTPDLDAMAPKLWVMSTQSSANISPLHHQRVKGREVIITEDPRLHLVWIYDRIFIKPLPQYLLSYAFWRVYLVDKNSPLQGDREVVMRSALGYLRTYYYLVQHESDFVLAQDAPLRLIAPDITWTQFSHFINQLSAVSDFTVSPRYSYGELRLTRLNFYIKFFQRKMHFQQVHGQYGAYFSQFYGPLLFVFSILSLILNAMQVELAIEQVDDGVHWKGMRKLARWCSVGVLVVSAVVTGLLAVVLVGKIVDEWVFAIKDRWGKRK